MLTQELIDKNYNLWVNLLKKYNCYTDSLIAEYGERFKVAPYGIKTGGSIATEGSAIHFVIYKLCKLANAINDGVLSVGDDFNNLKVSKESLTRVILLQHIAKAELFALTTEEWKMKRGMCYEFNNELTTSMKLGQRSAFICMKHGITLTEEEYEAMTIIDRDDFGNGFNSALSELVKVANSMVEVSINR